MLIPAKPDAAYPSEREADMSALLGMAGGRGVLRVQLTDGSFDVGAAPEACVTVAYDEQLAAGCGGVRNSTVWLSQGFLPEMQAAETADCSCDRHLCAGTCTKTDEELRCSPAQGVGVAWLVLRASGL